MKASRIADLLVQLVPIRRPVFIWGPPGVGKSSVVRQVAEQKKRTLIDIRASLLDPTDLRGLPYVEAGVAQWSVPSFLPRDPESSGILFFDELNAAPPLVQASLYQLTLDRRIGDYVLPTDWTIVGAGNRAEDRSVVFRMPAALANRFIHLEFEVDADEWLGWAIDHDIHPRVRGFIRTRRELLFDMSKADRAFPTPRSWEILSDALKALGSPQSATDVIAGIVGEAAGIEFLGYVSNSLTEEQIETVLANPDTAALPTALGELYALVSYVAARAREAKVLQAAGALLGRLSPELGVMMVRDVLRANKAFARSPGYLKFVKEHGGLLV